MTTPEIVFCSSGFIAVFALMLVGFTAQHIVDVRARRAVIAGGR